MPKPPDPFHEFVIELFAGLGPVRIRRMFGGAGVYSQDVMFGLLAEDQIFLKVDSDLRAALEAEGCVAFLWERPSDGRVMDLGYVGLPETALDDPDEAARWGLKALKVAQAAKLKAPPRRARKKPPR